MVYEGHTKGVQCLYLHTEISGEMRLITGSFDSTVMSFDVEVHGSFFFSISVDFVKFFSKIAYAIGELQIKNKQLAGNSTEKYDTLK